MAQLVDNGKRLGPPADPIPFPSPVIDRGIRAAKVSCYNNRSGKFEMVSNVLMKDPDRYDSPPKFAYVPVPFKDPIQTIMGHVEICRVLKRCERESNDLDEDEESMVEDEDLVFEWTDQRVAVKVNYEERMRKMRGRHAENPMQEIATMQLLGKEPVHVLGAMEVLFDGQNLNLVMRYCDSGDLFQLLQDSQGPEGTPGLTETQAQYWFKQIMLGVKFLHSRGICHRDISPENVMIDQNEGLIIDMGMALRMPYVGAEDSVKDISEALGDPPQRRLIQPQGPCGKLPYMSPEIYANRKPFDGEAIDIWTCGTILFCMVSGNRSYQRPHLSDPQFYWMTKGLRQMLSDWGVTLSEDGVQLMEGMLQVDPSKRLTVSQILNHPWLAGADEQPMELER